MANVTVSYTEKDIKNLIINDLLDRFNISMKSEDVVIQVKSKNNYRAQEWENGQLKIEFNKKLEV